MILPSVDLGGRWDLPLLQEHATVKISWTQSVATFDSRVPLIDAEVGT
jgi:hypothetical protein